MNVSKRFVPVRNAFYFLIDPLIGQFPSYSNQFIEYFFRFAVGLLLPAAAVDYFSVLSAFNVFNSVGIVACQHIGSAKENRKN